MASKMKKFNIRGMLDGLRQSVGSSSPKSEAEIEENLRSEHLQVCKTVRHGFPYQPTSVAFDSVQQILAVGTKSGSLRIFGQPGVDLHCHHDADVAVLQILFLVNEGALVTSCSDDSLHLWNFRQKRPEIVQTLKFQRERITHCHLSFQSKWLYVGTERGNVHIVNIESFILSGYVINWNKAIELSRKTHPGPVVHLSDNPLDPSKLLIGFESGAIVLWDLKNKTAECRYSSPEALRSVSWQHEGKQFMASHTDGSLTTWNIRASGKPCNIMTPHAKIGKDGKPDPCKPITKVEWKSVRNGEPLVIFSGGMSYDRAGRTPCITVMTGKTTTVLEMEYNVVDFVVLCETPWQNDFQDPYAIVVLLQNDLVVIDLTSPGYPCFENPYPMDIHESPVTACQYFADCPTDLIPAFYSVGSKQKRTGFSEKRWPIRGGEWGTATCSYPEIVVTGHADGSLKFWDASAVSLQVLYKLKTAKIFEKPKNKTLEGQEDDPFAIYLIFMDVDSRILCLAGATHVILCRFSKQEMTLEVPSVDVTIVYEVFDDLDSPDLEYPKPSLGVMSQHQQSGSVGSYSSNTSDSTRNSKPSLSVVAQQQKSGSMGSYSSQSDSTKPEQTTALKVRSGARKWGTGYQPDLVCLLTWMDNEHPGNITSLSLNSSYGLLAFGNESGLAIVDIVQKSCLLNLGTPDLYGSMDPYQRAPRSPRGKRPQPFEGSNPTLHSTLNEDGARSPTSDQPLSPTSNAPIPPPRKKHLQNVKLDCIREGGSFDFGAFTPPTEKKLLQDYETKEENTKSSLEDLNSSNTEEDKTNQELMHPDEERSEEKTEEKEMVVKRGLAKRAVSLPLVNVPQDVLSSSPLSEKSLSHETLTPQTPEEVDVNLKDSFDSDHVKVIDSDTETKAVKDKESHHSRRISMKNIKKKFKHRTKKVKNIEYSGKLVMDPNDPNTGQVSPTEHKGDSSVQSENGKGSETDDNAFTDDDVTSPTVTSPMVDQSEKAEKEGGFFRKMSVKVKNLVNIGHDHSDDEADDKKIKKYKITVIDLTEDNNNSKMVIHKMSLKDLFQSQQGRLWYKHLKHIPLHLFDRVDTPTVKINGLCMSPTTARQRGKAYPELKRSRSQGTQRKLVKAQSVASTEDPNYGGVDKNDGTSFSRSRSSSMSSLENVSKEAIQSLVFADSYTRKFDNFTCPCLWVGTSLGSVLVIVMNLPQAGEQRLTQPVIVSPSGTIFRLKGAIQAMSFLDCNGLLIAPESSGAWKENSRDSKDDKNSKTSTPQKLKISPSSSTEVVDRQFAILCSEKQARVVSLPSQTCPYKVRISESSFVVKADIVTLKGDSVCLACYVANGHIMVYSLPSLKLLLDVEFLALTDLRIARTFCFSHQGHALYMSSPTELQKVTFSAEFCDNLSEMLGDLFLPCEAPEAPKQGFFKNLFSGGTSTLDREELFGEASGKGPRGLATRLPGSGGLQHLQAQAAGTVAGDVSRARMLLTERGEKLAGLGDKTEDMAMQAQVFQDAAHQLMLKYKDKKWYQF